MNRIDDNFVKQNMGLVHSLANRFRGRGIEYEELVSAGCMGLVKAAKGFDDSRGLCFSTYAVPVILGEMKRLFRDGGTVKVSRTLKELSLKAVRVQEQLQKAGEEPRLSDIAERLGVTPAEAGEALAVSLPPVSLTADEENGSEYDLPVPPEQAKLTDSIALRQCLDLLPHEDRELIRLRYWQNKTQGETGRLLSMSQVQVSRREKKILLKLRQLMG